jgi:hypothetical protein
MSTRNPNPTGPGPYSDVDSAWGCGWAWLWFWLFIIVIIFAGWGWGGWYGGWGGPRGWWGPREAPQPQATAPQATQPPIVTAPGDFVGRTVTLSGQVDQVFGPQVFTLAGASGGRPLLIISKKTITPAVKSGETVQFTGTVEKYNTTALHEQTSVDLSKVPSGEFAERPVVVASSVSSKSTPG